MLSRVSFVVLTLALYGCIAEMGAVDEGEIAEAEQAITCSGYGCDGQDPIATGCANDAMNANPTPVCTDDGFCVNLRYSPTCKTNWTKIWNVNGKVDDIQGWVKAQDGRKVCYPELCSAFSTIHSDSLYTDMLYCPDGTCLARACFAKYGRYAPATCTGWY